MIEYVIIGLLALLIVGLFIKIKNLEKKMFVQDEKIWDALETGFKMSDDVFNNNFKKVQTFHNNYKTNVKIINENEKELEDRLNNIEKIIKYYGLDYGGKIK